MAAILWRIHTTSSQQHALAWSWHKTRRSFLSVVLSKKGQLFNHPSATVGSRRDIGSLNVPFPLEQWQVGKVRQRHPERAPWRWTGFAKAELGLPVMASHGSTALSDSKGKKFLPAQQLRHCLFPYKNTVGCTPVAGILLHGITGKIPYWFLGVRIRPVGTEENNPLMNIRCCHSS